jgi:predicted nucleic acid-binding protein
VATLLQLPVTVETDPAMFQRAYELAAGLGWAKTYDAEYVATASTLSVALVTLDSRLARGVAGLVPVLAPADVPPV